MIKSTEFKPLAEKVKELNAKLGFLYTDQHGTDHVAETKQKIKELKEDLEENKVFIDYRIGSRHYYVTGYKVSGRYYNENLALIPNKYHPQKIEKISEKMKQNMVDDIHCY